MTAYETLSSWNLEQLKNPSSWVIRCRTTGEVVAETFNRKVADAINTAKYEAVPIGKHLSELNDRSIK